MKCTRMDQLLSLVICTLLLLLKAEGVAVPITYVQSAVAKGAGKELLLSLITKNIKFKYAVILSKYTFFCF